MLIPELTTDINRIKPTTLKTGWNWNLEVFPDRNEESPTDGDA